VTANSHEPFTAREWLRRVGVAHRGLGLCGPLRIARPGKRDSTVRFDILERDPHGTER